MSPLACITLQWFLLLELKNLLSYRNKGFYVLMTRQNKESNPTIAMNGPDTVKRLYEGYLHPGMRMATP